MNLEELKDHLEPENIGSAPFSVRIGVIAVLFVAILYAGFHFLTRDQLAELEQHEKMEFERLMSTFENERGRSSSLRASEAHSSQRYRG